MPSFAVFTRPLQLELPSCAQILHIPSRPQTPTSYPSTPTFSEVSDVESVVLQRLEQLEAELQAEVQCNAACRAKLQHLLSLRRQRESQRRAIQVARGL